MKSNPRPLSPHIGIYRWPITMALSILHRASGIALATGLVVLLLFVMSLAAGPESYLRFSWAIASPLGQLALFGWSAAFFYHLSNGIRHLFWDAGYGFHKAQANRSSYVVLASTIVLTATLWLVLL
ncbi:MAG: succinate dehydrogenase, cytochrome b556 subunit [Pseudomonadota bacterium]